VFSTIFWAELQTRAHTDPKSFSGTIQIFFVLLLIFLCLFLITFFKMTFKREFFCKLPLKQKASAIFKFVFISGCLLFLILFARWTILHFALSGFLVKFALVFGMFIVPAIPFLLLLDAYLFRRNLIHRLTGKKVGIRYLQSLGSLELTFVINQSHLQGHFCTNLVRTIAPSFIYTGKFYTIWVPLVSDLSTRIAAYSDLEERFDPWSLQNNDDPTINATLDFERNIPFGQSMHKAGGVRKAWFLDSSDYYVVRKHSKRAPDFEWRFSRVLDNVCLVVGKNTSNDEIALFERIRALNPTIDATAIVLDTPSWSRIRMSLHNADEIASVDGERVAEREILHSFMLSERNRIKRRIETRSALDWLVDLKAVIAKIEDIKHESEKNGSGRNGEAEKIRTDYLTSLQLRYNPEFVQSEFDRNAIPASLRDFLFEPARDLIARFSHAPNYFERVYIAFNILELIVRSAVAFHLANLPGGHSLRKEFPGGITGSDGPHGDVADYTDLVRFLVEGPGKSGLSNDFSRHLSHGLIQAVEPPGPKLIDRLKLIISCDDIRPLKTVSDFLCLSVEMRNQVRGHGVVTPLVASICYPVLLHCLAHACRYVAGFAPVFSQRGPGGALVDIDGMTINCSPFIIYLNESKDFFFLEGRKKKSLLYVGYASGERFKPATYVVEGSS
jgi:hypothetical protein